MHGPVGCTSCLASSIPIYNWEEKVRKEELRGRKKGGGEALRQRFRGSYAAWWLWESWLDFVLPVSLLHWWSRRPSWCYQELEGVNTLLVGVKEMGVFTMTKVTIVHMSWWCVREQVGEKQVVTRHSLHRLWDSKLWSGFHPFWGGEGGGEGYHNKEAF